MKRTVWTIAIFHSLVASTQGQAQYAYTTQFDISQIGNAYGIATDSSNNVYVAGFDGGTVTKFTSSSSYTQSSTLLSGLNSGGANPYGLAVTGNQLYVSNFQANSISVYNSSTGASQFTFGGLSIPEGMNFDSTGNLYVADAGHRQISVFKGDGTYLSSIAANVTAPCAVAVDKNGNIYFVAYSNSYSTLFKYNSAGNLVATLNAFSYPIGVAVDSKNDVFVSDQANNRVAEYDSNLNFLQSIGTGITSGPSSISSPWAITIDSNDDLFVIDGQHRVVEFSPPAGVPEPSSLILCGLIAGGGFGAVFLEALAANGHQSCGNCLT